MSRCFLLIAVTSLTALAVACGSTSTTDTPDTKATAASTTSAAKESPQQAKSAKASLCTMLPKEDMEAILGGPLTNVTAKDSTGKTQCTYVGFGRYADVSIEWNNGEAGMAGARLAAKFMGATAGSVPVMTPIQDLGDEAVMMIGGVLNVRKGDDLITVELRTQKNSDVVGPTIVRKIIEQL